MQLQQLFLEYCGELLARVDSDGFVVALDRYYWGATGGTLALGQVLVLCDQVSPGQLAFEDAALQQMHYVLGRNALNTSFVSGFGSRSPQAIHHAVFANDGLERIFPGLLVGGPNASTRSDEILAGRFDAGTPPALCWVDHVDSYASNENCILYNAPLVALAFYFAVERPEPVRHR